MQDMHEYRRENGFLREIQDRIVGEESAELQKTFDERRKALMERIESGETESATIRESRRIGRNDPCPCGSNEKFKKCCGKRFLESDERIKP